jgi:hypothetical protein
MPDNSPLRDDDVKQARALTERLLAGVESQERRYLSQRLEIPTHDVEVDVERFAAQLRFAKSDGLGIPCLEMKNGDPVPIDIWSLVWGWFPFSLEVLRAREFTYRNFIDDYFRLAMTGQPDPERRVGRVPFLLVEPSKALSFLRTRLETFLAVRFSARKSNISKSPGLQFRVDTKSSGLRVHFSRACFFNPTSVLGSPTTPVIGWLPPGRYVFGACVPGQPPVFDLNAEYDIPPNTKASLAQ